LVSEKPVAYDALLKKAQAVGNQQAFEELDCCDRHGILIRSEIPAWGTDTFVGMGAEPDTDVMEDGLEQEMITRDRNRPSVVVWGLCNELADKILPRISREHFASSRPYRDRPDANGSRYRKRKQRQPRNPWNG
jgi:beta-galactosidase/beta-glucuronidase